MAARPAVAWFVAFLLLVSTSCKSTLDSLGCKERTLDGGIDSNAKLGNVLGPAAYPNAFRDLLGKTDAEIAAKVNGAFDQLFHGDPSSEAIYYPVGADKAYIHDVLHNEIRTEGIGLGMLITVSLDKRDEFDRLWRYAKSIQVASGPAQGYMPSYCTDSNGDEVTCYDPYGLEQMAAALVLARGRWQSSPGSIDYGAEAATVIDLIRNKEIYNCGVAGGITATFNEQSQLPYSTPTTASAGISRPSIVMPAYYELWRQATGDAFWAKAAAAGRAFWQASANPSTGLLPERATFDGKPLATYDRFASECLRIFFSMALDRIWWGSQPWLVDEANRLLQFFNSKGLTTYGLVFSLDGTTIKTMHERTLVSANGALALVSTTDLRRDFVNEVWALGAPSTGAGRYYPGITQLLALVILSGQLRVY